MIRVSISGKGKLVARGGTKERRAEVLQDVRQLGKTTRDCIFYDEEQFSTDQSDPLVAGVWVCSYCGESSKRRRGIKHYGCRWSRKKK